MDFQNVKIQLFLGLFFNFAQPWTELKNISRSFHLPFLGLSEIPQKWYIQTNKQNNYTKRRQLCSFSDMDTEYTDTVYVQIWIPSIQILFMFRYGYRIYRYCLCLDMDTEYMTLFMFRYGYRIYNTVYVQIWIPSI